MAYRSMVQAVIAIPIVLKLWRALANKGSAIGDCLHALAGLEPSGVESPEKRLVAREWTNTMPLVLQLCDKLPNHTGAICDYIKTLPMLMQITRNLPDVSSSFVQQFQQVSCHSVIREEYLESISRGKRVLHFGFLDSPFSEERLQSGELLHLKLKNAATWLYGIDNDQPALDRYRHLTGDRDNAAADVQTELPHGMAERAFDLILFPEILEHLGNPARALGNLRRLCRNDGATKLCVTVPNAYYTGALLRALRGEEIVHPEHYYYFSPATLRRLLSDAGFTVTELALYSSRDSSNLPGITKNGVIALCQAA
ncbi:hypothetical protein W02_16150 [Nitrospira sp. KM1]|uniref:methyltransferase domain-containing protein n=1 Tax=Nitrospira sp. KM1 TaxID=1936990 RepID=UPI0013A7596A|nr:methyltransferase domain-containing protein [Nitrospira sp. KM1]BCA54475.1 hypothetical protein W02_16150 [Nitrospira sp. KM1]